MVNTRSSSAKKPKKNPMDFLEVEPESLINKIDREDLLPPKNLFEFPGSRAKIDEITFLKNYLKTQRDNTSLSLHPFRKYQSFVQALDPPRAASEPQQS